MPTRSPSTRLPDAPTLPAIALVEVLIAGAILASATVMFLLLWREARTDLSRARERDQASPLAVDVLQNAQRSWPAGATSGTRGALSWRITCSLPPDLRSPRLAVVQCAVAVTTRGREILTLESAWAASQSALLAR